MAASASAVPSLFLDDPKAGGGGAGGRVRGLTLGEETPTTESELVPSIDGLPASAPAVSSSFLDEDMRPPVTGGGGAGGRVRGLTLGEATPATEGELAPSVDVSAGPTAFLALRGVTSYENCG